MSHLKKIIKYLTNILTGFLIVILFLVIYGKLVTLFSKNAYPNYFGYTFFEVKSGSMEPTLHINDVILVKVTKDNLQKDDIIAFYGEKEFITHRIIFIDGDVITVKGDNNNTIDKPIRRDQVIGKVVKILNNLGIWKKVFMDPKILAFIFITLLLFDYALSYNKPASKNEETKQEKSKIDYKSLIKEKMAKLKKTPKVKKVIPIKKEDEKPILKEEAKEKIPEIIKVEIPEEPKPVKIKEPEKLLELTRKINVEEINKLLEGTDLELTKPEISEVKNEIKKIEKEIKKEEPKVEDCNKPKEEIKSELTKKEKEFLDYTIRLDLSEIQKRIDRKVR